MRWILLLISLVAIPVVWGVASETVLITAFLVMFANFASFCMLYDQPLERARSRVSARLRGLDPNSDIAQVLHTAAIKTTGEDRQLGITPMVLLNFASAAASAALLVWGLYLRVA